MQQNVLVDPEFFIVCLLLLFIFYHKLSFSICWLEIKLTRRGFFSISSHTYKGKHFSSSPSWVIFISSLLKQSRKVKVFSYDDESGFPEAFKLIIWRGNSVLIWAKNYSSPVARLLLSRNKNVPVLSIVMIWRPWQMSDEARLKADSSTSSTLCVCFTFWKTERWMCNICLWQTVNRLFLCMFWLHV